MAQRAMRWSPSTSCARLVDRQHAVGVAVEGQARRRPRRRPPRRWRASGWVEPQPSLMLRPSGSAWSTSTVGAERGAARRRRTPSAAPLAQSTTTCRPSRRRPSSEADERRRATRPPAGAGAAGDRRRAGPAGVGLGQRGASSAASSCSSTSSDSLRPPAAKNLMPLSPNGLCDAEIIAPGTPSGGAQPRHRRGGHDAEALRPARLRRRARRRGPPRAGTRRAGVAADDEARGPAEHPGRGRAEGGARARR